MTKTSGTKEWASSNVNIYQGCSHNCKYCYGKQMALRFGRIQSDDEWRTMIPNEKAINKNYQKRKGRIMFPTSHDITAKSFDVCVVVLEKLVRAGNEVLVTTKPQIWIIEELCAHFDDWKDQIQFRFTITSYRNARLKFWEPGAPSFGDRIAALDIAHYLGYKTSVSMEPFLDPDPEILFSLVKPDVTESIWIGPMNHISSKPEYVDVRQNYTRENLRRIYEILKDEPLVRWKDAFLEKMGGAD